MESSFSDLVCRHRADCDTVAVPVAPGKAFMCIRVVRISVCSLCCFLFLISCSSGSGSKSNSGSGGSSGSAGGQGGLAAGGASGHGGQAGSSSGAAGKGGQGGGGATGNGAAGSPFDAGACSSANPDASHPDNSEGDLCLHAPTMDCFNAFSGTWSCNTNSGQFVVGHNGYIRITNALGQVGAGCMDCSGKFTALADDQSWVNDDGTFVVTDSSAAMTWRYCTGETVQACMQAGGTPATATCTRVSCAVP